MINGATIKWQGGQRIEAVIDKRIIVLSPTSENDTVSPGYIFLISLGSLCAVEMISQIKINKLDIESFEINTQAAKDKENKNIFNAFEIEFVFSGKSINIPKLLNSIQTAVYENSGIAIMISKFAKIDYSLFVNGKPINKSDYSV